MNHPDGRNVRGFQPSCGKQCGENEIRNEDVRRIVGDLRENPRNLIFEILWAFNDRACDTVLLQCGGSRAVVPAMNKDKASNVDPLCAQGRQ
jgi:hypothetical protein